MVDAAGGPLASIVIPVLNDAEALGATLPLLVEAAAGPTFEVIVVDGSDAADPAMAALRDRYRTVTWLQSVRGRGAQMNHGARRARGGWIVFLHADTRLGNGWIDAIRCLDSRREIVGGSFRFALDSAAPWARWIERGVRIRVRLLDLPYGDQALFVRRTVFRELGGYRELPLMEDVEFVRRLRHSGRLARLRIPAVTSARRWERDGWMRRTLENVMLTALFLGGQAPERLARRYHRRNASGHAKAPAGSVGE